MKKFKLNKENSKRMLYSVGVGIATSGVTALSLFMLSSISHADLNSDFAKNYITIATCAAGIIMIPISNFLFKEYTNDKNSNKKNK